MRLKIFRIGDGTEHGHLRDRTATVIG
jgi:hypothetical protein